MKIGVLDIRRRLDSNKCTNVSQKRSLLYPQDRGLLYLMTDAAFHSETLLPIEQNTDVTSHKSVIACL
jgi:hypothetical protein